VSKKQPKMIENHKGELVTKGRWVSETELERQGRQIAEQYYGIGAQKGIEQTSFLYRGLNLLSLNIYSAFTIGMCGNTSETRTMAAQTLAEMRVNKDACQDIWDQRANLHALTIDGGYIEYLQFADEVIELLEAYTTETENKTDPHTEQHAALRAYFKNLDSEMAEVVQGRLMVTHARKIEPPTKYIGERALAYEEQHGKANNYLIGVRIYEELDQMLPENRKRIAGAEKAYERLSQYCEMKGETGVVKEDQEEKLKKAIDNAKQAVMRT